MGETEKIDEIKVTRHVQAVLVLNASKSLIRKFKIGSSHNPEAAVTVTSCSLRAEFVPVLKVLVLDISADGKPYREAFKGISWPKLGSSGFKVSESRREYVTVDSHQEAVVAAVEAWQKWQAVMDAQLDEQLKELVVQEVMDA